MVAHHALQVELAHKARDGAAGDVLDDDLALPPQLMPDLENAVAAAAFLVDPLDLDTVLCIALGAIGGQVRVPGNGGSRIISRRGDL